MSLLYEFWEVRIKKFTLLLLIFLNACTAAQPQVTVPPYVIPNQTQTALVQDLGAAKSAVETEVAEYPRLCEVFISPFEYSPDGLWREELCYSDADRGLVLTLSNRETKVLWKLSYHDYIPNIDSLPDGGMAISHWSNDGQYAYFYSFMNSSGGECFRRGSDSGWGVFRINLQTGDVTSVLSAGDNLFIWYDFSFSPTDQRLVYGLHAKDYIILDMTTGHSIPVTSIKKYTDGGGFVWSSNGRAFVYSTVFRDTDDLKYETSVRLVDAQSGREKMLVESTNNCYLVREWQQDDMLIIESFADQKVFGYDLKSNSVVDFPVTPRP